MQVKLANVRLAFPHLFEAKKGNSGEGEPRFSAAFPIAPGSANDKQLEAAVAAVAKEKWGAKADGVLAKLRSDGRIGYKKTPLANSEGEVYDGFQDMHAVNTSSKTRPFVCDGQKNTLTAADGKPYAGCYVNAVVEVWAQDNSFGRRINVQLKGVQFAKDGDAFGGGAPAKADDFESIEEGADVSDIV
jgi:hypothetical protein